MEKRSEDRKNCLMKRGYDEYKEISKILETSVGGLKASYHLAVKKVEKYLKGETETTQDPGIKPFT